MTPAAAAPLTCAEAEPLLPLVADGALSPADDPALFEHLAACPRCQESLAHHDLISLALAQPRPAAPKPRVIRHRWWLALPVAAAAGLVLNLLLAPSGTAPSQPPMAAISPPAPAQTEPIIIERDVAAVPGGMPGKRLILVRRGDQVVLVDPAASEESPRQDATPASLRY